MFNPFVRALLRTAPLTTALFAPSIDAQDLVAIKAGRVITVTGAELTNAVILCENGRITELGTDLEVPWNATVIDASDKVVMPTFVLAHTSGGMGRGGSNERMESVPFLSIADGLDPSTSFFEESLRNGVGTLHVSPGNDTLLGGIGMVVRPVGKTVEDMTVRNRASLKLSLHADNGNQVAQIRKLRRSLEAADETRKDFARQRQEFEKEKAAGATDKKTFEGEPDESKQVTIELIEGKLRGFLYLPGAAQVAEVVRMKQKWADIDLVLVVGPQCYKAARQLAELKLPVILEPDALEYYERDPETEVETLVSPAKILANAGVPLVFSVSDSQSSPQRYPWWQMATAIRHGVDRETALRALTTEPAKLLGIDDDFGSIEVGKVANFQILTGDPLRATSWVDTVLLEGETVYERAKDSRLQHLFGKDRND